MSAPTIPALTVTFDGLELLVTRCSDEQGRLYVERAYLGQDGVELEDLGKRPARFRVESIFFGSSWWNDVTALRQAVEQSRTEAAVFVHPWWGRFEGAVTEFSVETDERRWDYATVSFTFVEAGLGGATASTLETLSTALAAAEAAISDASAALAALEG